MKTAEGIGAMVVRQGTQLSGVRMPDHQTVGGESRALTVWLTGLPSAGKTTLAHSVAEALRHDAQRVEVLDGDSMRKQLGPELGFSPEDRWENLRRIAFIAGLLTSHGVIVVVSAIAPYRSVRGEILKGLSPFLEVFVNAPVEVCERRDVKGLYRRYRMGEVKGLTGEDDVYEAPLSPDVECRTDLETVEQSTNKILAALHVASVIGKQINHH